MTMSETTVFINKPTKSLHFHFKVNLFLVGNQAITERSMPCSYYINISLLYWMYICSHKYEQVILEKKLQ